MRRVSYATFSGYFVKLSFKRYLALGMGEFYEAMTYTWNSLDCRRRHCILVSPT